MVRITIELCPKGDVSNPQHLGTGYIINDAHGTKQLGNYDVVLSKRGRPKTIWKRGRVVGFKREQFGAWDLLCWELVATRGGRADHCGEAGAENGAAAGDGNIGLRCRDGEDWTVPLQDWQRHAR